MQVASKDRLNAHLKAYQQEHLLAFWSDLESESQDQLARQLDAIDFELMQQLHAGSRETEDLETVASRATSPAAVRLEGEASRDSDDAHEAAGALIAAGKIGAMLVAGGQGTRLGFPHPKGMFPIGPLSDRSLFQMHIDQLLAIGAHHGVRLPLYLMTSPATHDPTLKFLQEHDNFGLPREDLHVFCQGTMPAVDLDGKLLLDAPDHVAESPDGHGGMLAAFCSSGCLQDAQERGLEQLFYFQVDNPLAKVCDQSLIGHHLLADSEMTTQVVAKGAPDDKVGNVVDVDGRLMVIEYSDLPAEVGERRNADGTLELWAGNIAIHVFRVDFLERAAQSNSALPFHRARKKVPFVNERGELVEPAAPNATKFERFIFDLMPSAKNAIAVEAAEADVFAPVKNASGSPKDTPETAQAAILARDRLRIESSGVELAPDVAIEINPRYAYDAKTLRDKLPQGTRIDRDTYFH